MLSIDELEANHNQKSRAARPTRYSAGVGSAPLASRVKTGCFGGAAASTASSSRMRTVEIGPEGGAMVGGTTAIPAVSTETGPNICSTRSVSSTSSSISS